MAERLPDTQPKMASRSLFTASFVLLCATGVVLAIVLQSQAPVPGKANAGLGAGGAVTSSSQIFCYDGIQTLSEDAEAINCFGVSGGHFTQVFQREQNTAATDVEIRSGYVIPGLWDGHGHVMQYGEFLHSVDLFGSDSPDEARRRIVDYIELHPEAGTEENWIRGVGWDQMALGGMPTAVRHLRPSPGASSRSLTSLVGNAVCRCSSCRQICSPRPR
jgi:hypothetical protein